MRPSPSVRRKIGFLVEGETDRLIVETIARKILPDSDWVRVIRSGGGATLPWARDLVSLLLEEKDYLHVVVLVDADSINDRDIKSRRERVESMIDLDSFKGHASVCFAVPEIEAWLLAKYEPKPESYQHPKEYLTRLLREQKNLSLRDRLQEEIETLDLRLARRRSPSLNDFLQVIERVIEIKKD